MTRTARIAVIGAGIGGLAAACALHEQGFEVHVYERAGELGEAGAGLQLGPNAVKVLRALGIEEQLRPLACEPANIVSVAWDDAHLRFREPLKATAAPQFGAPYLTAHRADLHALLQAKLPADSIHLNTRCTKVSTFDGAARAVEPGSGPVSGARTLEKLPRWPLASLASAAVATFADGREVEADIVVGADGINSAVRDSLFGAQPARYTQQMAWRCIVPIDCVPTDIGPGKSVKIGRDEYVGWIGPDGHVICYPIRGGELYNIFAGHVSEEWVEESWSVPSSVDELLSGYRGWNAALIEMFGQVRHCYKWGIRDRDPLARWTQGRATLLGDAAHPMMPTLAQGAAITLEDAYALARNLARHENPDEGLQAYERERRPRASRVQLQAREQFQNNRKAPAPPPLSRDWIFAHDATLERSSATE
jgi:2-polyprenyl-6-methoxyphenol hydroxylase-like FAD-dependent oxidoreductase